MKRIVCISDTHTQHDKLKLPPSDCLIHAGDWTYTGTEKETIAFLKWFNAQDYKFKLFISGNHDFMAQRDYAGFMRLVKIHAPSCIYLQDETVEIDGFKIFGSPVSPFFHDWAFNRWGVEIQRHWDLIPHDVDILITHTPMYGKGDKLGPNGSQPYMHIGCPYLRIKVDKDLYKLRALICGHIHISYGIYEYNDIIVANASILDEDYKIRNEPIIIDL